jgi:exodeoxyribonuclease VII large subunit
MISITVAQVARHIKGLLETDPILTDVWVSGEVSNLSKPASGHCYFTLKDGTAQLRCAFFRQHSNSAAVAALDHGAQVLAHGHVSFYEARGDIQLYVDAVQPEGIGVLQAEFERLLAQLDADGLFAVERKRPLPDFPRKIGVVTSPSGAVFHDICHVLSRRWPLVEVVLAPTTVQGDGAAPGVVAALKRLNARDDIDVIVVARGGGSLEDLWAFNEEAVARAIYASRIPVVSAVGHETDYTIADYVADLRAPTPSAAAELLVPDQIEIAVHVGSNAQALSSYISYALDSRRAALDSARAALQFRRPNPARLAAELALAVEKMQRRTAHELAMRSERLLGRQSQLLALSPLATLARGYALVHADTGRLLVRAADVRAGEQIRVRMVDGGFAARVEGNGSKPHRERSRPIEIQQSRLL